MLMIFGCLVCAVVIGFIAALLVAEIRRDRDAVGANFSTEQKQPPGTPSRKIYQCSFMDKSCVEAPRPVPTPRPRPTPKTYRDV
jgi:hypothetical protein